MMTKFKVGDKVRAIDNEYGITRLEDGWEGVITKVYTNGDFDAETTKHRNDDYIGAKYSHLPPAHFEIISGKYTKKQRIEALEQTTEKQAEQIAELQSTIAKLREALA